MNNKCLFQKKKVTLEVHFTQNQLKYAIAKAVAGEIFYSSVFINNCFFLVNVVLLKVARLKALEA